MYLTLPGISNFLSRTPWSVKSRTRTAKGKALIRENERWREKADPQSGMKVRCPFPCSQRLIEPATSPQNPIKTHHIICHHTVSYHHMVYYTKSSIKGKREKHWKTRVINDLKIISVVYHRGLPLLHFKRWASQYQQEVLPRWKMCTARARQKVLPSKWLIQLLKIACNDEMWSFPSMQ